MGVSHERRHSKGSLCVGSRWRPLSDHCVPLQLPVVLCKDFGACKEQSAECRAAGTEPQRHHQGVSTQKRRTYLPLPFGIHFKY